jgi:hypothetical protein
MIIFHEWFTYVVVIKTIKSYNIKLDAHVARMVETNTTGNVRIT